MGIERFNAQAMLDQFRDAIHFDFLSYWAERSIEWVWVDMLG